MTLKSNDVFGIDGYNIPKHEYPFYCGKKNAFPKEKGKNFAEFEASLTKCVPGPGEYKVAPKWGLPEKKVSITKKNSYIDQIFRIEKEKPSPSQVHY